MKNFEELQKLIISWAKDKDLLHAENVDKQFMKFIEVKTDTGRVREEQKHFLEIMKATGALAGIARNEKDALEIIGVL